MCAFVLTDDVDVKRQSCFVKHVSRAQCQRTEKILSYKLMHFFLRKHPDVQSYLHSHDECVFAPLALISSFTKWHQGNNLVKSVPCITPQNGDAVQPVFTQVVIMAFHSSLYLNS